MATFEKRGSRWRVRVRRDGIDISESFRLKSEAQAWAAQREADASSGKLGRALDRSFGDALRKYLEGVADHKDGGAFERTRIRAFVGEPGKTVRQSWCTCWWSKKALLSSGWRLTCCGVCGRNLATLVETTSGC